MSEFHFCAHQGRFTRRLDTIAHRHGATVIRYDDPAEGARVWMVAPNLGHPFDSSRAAAVYADIAEAGGIDAFRKKRKEVRQ